MANPDFSYWALQANTSPQQVGSVEFRFDNKIKHIENIFPYTFKLPHHLRSGAHTVVAKVYSEPNRNGVEGIGRTANNYHYKVFCCGQLPHRKYFRKVLEAFKRR